MSSRVWMLNVIRRFPTEDDGWIEWGRIAVYMFKGKAIRVWLEDEEIYTVKGKEFYGAM